MKHKFTIKGQGIDGAIAACPFGCGQVFKVTDVVITPTQPPLDRETYWQVEVDCEKMPRVDMSLEAVADELERHMVAVNRLIGRLKEGEARPPIGVPTMKPVLDNFTNLETIKARWNSVHPPGPGWIVPPVVHEEVCKECRPAEYPTCQDCDIVDTAMSMRSWERDSQGRFRCGDCVKKRREVGKLDPLAIVKQVTEMRNQLIVCGMAGPYDVHCPSEWSKILDERYGITDMTLRERLQQIPDVRLIHAQPVFKLESLPLPVVCKGLEMKWPETPAVMEPQADADRRIVEQVEQLYLGAPANVVYEQTSMSAVDGNVLQPDTHADWMNDPTNAEVMKMAQAKLRELAEQGMDDRPRDPIPDHDAVVGSTDGAEPEKIGGADEPAVVKVNFREFL